LSKELASPVVNKDRSITFNLKSENSKEVEIDGELRFGREKVGPHKPIPPVPMKTIDNNVWTFTTEPVDPGVYGYFFVIDGIKTLDPLNPRKSYPVYIGSSLVKVEGDEPMPWDLIPDISHGTVVIEKFYSKALKQVKPCAVYLPPGYRSTEKKYPILYLQHGGGDDYLGWLFQGKADNIVDYMIAKKTDEIIVVMPEGHVTTPEEHYRMLARGEGRIPEQNLSERYLDYYVNDIMPFIEKKYRILKDSRAIAGLSMGGGESLYVAMNHPSLFKALGVFSSGSAGRFLDIIPQFKDQLKKIKTIYISGGIYDTALETFRALHKRMDESGISHTYVETNDGGHIWLVWQNALTRFLTRL
jgi:enterochelin esterase-like enzyme